VFKTPAAHLGARQNLYAVDGEAVFSVNYVDAAWGQYEPALPQALDALVRGQEASVAAQVWLETLVPFVASLFVRRANFATDLETALGLSAKDEPPGNFNRARLFEFQRLLALVMVSRWVILRADSEDEDCLVSDLAFAPLKVPDHSYPGLAIPLDRQHLLALLPQPTKTLLAKHEGNWVTNVEHVTLSPQAIHAFNRTTAHYAQEFIAGRSSALVESFMSIMGHPRMRLPTLQETFRARHRLLIAHEFEWHRLVTALRSQMLETDSAAWSWDAALVADAGCPQVYLPTNLPTFATGLATNGWQVQLSLTEAPGFTDTYSDESSFPPALP